MDQSIIYIIIALQLGVFIYTWGAIEKLKLIFPSDGNGYQIREYIFNIFTLKTTEPALILNNIKEYVYDSSDEVPPSGEKVALLAMKNFPSSVFQEISFTLNTYLLRNKGSAVDFNLIKDVVERRIDIEDNKVSMNLSTPLYLGLMGTMLTIFFGVHGFSDTIEGSTMGNNVSVKNLLSNVGFGMIASVIGLLLTIFNNVIYRNSKGKLEVRKNQFYSFIQISLLPLISQSLQVGFHNLQATLQQFNTNFTNNISKLEDVTIMNIDALNNQTEMLNYLKEVDIKVFVEANVVLLGRIKGVIEKLNLLGSHVDSISGFISVSNQLSHRLESILDKTQDVADISKHIKETVIMNHDLTSFLRSHYSELNDRSSLIIEAIGRTDISLDNALKELNEKVLINHKKYVEFTNDETLKLNEVMAQNELSLKNLDKLAVIEKSMTALVQNNKNIENAISRQSDTNKKLLESLIVLQKQQLGLLAEAKEQGTWLSKSKRVLKTGLFKFFQIKDKQNTDER